DDSVDWHDHRIYRHASSYYPLPDENYSTGQYIVLHEEDGTDDLIANCWHFYNALGTGLRGTDQNIFITDPGTASTYVDAVIYSDANGTYTANKDKANDLVADSMWNTYDFTTGDAGAWTDSDDIGSGQTLARYRHPGAPVYADNNNKGDWYKETTPSQGLQNDQALPVALSSFEARYFDNGVILRWITESETNNLGFEIYRGESKDGPFEKITPHRIAGAGTTASQNKYEYIDETAVEGNKYFYYVEDIDFSGEKGRSETIPAVSGPFGKEKPKMFGESSVLGQPVKFQVFQNFPNPFNPETWIPFQIPEATDVTVKIYNVFGQAVRTIDLGQKEVGRYLSKDESIHWDGRNQNGELVPSGVYFYQFRAGKFMAMKKMLLVK
ncbi:T9SS type A sorting domain-containing protein, partial [bacterium]|nr:T9SS type A sorting domain-containing protein [bacterium]